MDHFLHILLHYLYEIVPALAIGFFISGIVHEMVPEDAVVKYLGKGGIRPILYSTLIGAALPVCCWGSLPIAISFHKKGARLGPILAFLVATPATSISALLVAYNVLGPLFAAYTFFAVIVIGLVMGIVGDRLRYEFKATPKEVPCPHCESGAQHAHTHNKGLRGKVLSALKYAYVDMPKEIGLELLIGLVLAAFVATYIPMGNLIRTYLAGGLSYVFSVVFGLVTYICSTASVPLIDSLIKQGMNPGAAMTLLLIGPITSYGTILVLRKEYGSKILTAFLATLIILTVAAGAAFQFIRSLL